MFPRCKCYKCGLSKIDGYLIFRNVSTRTFHHFDPTFVSRPSKLTSLEHCGFQLTLYQTKNVQIESDHRLNVAKMVVSEFDREDNIVGKGENTGLPAFSPFPTMFLKGFFLGIV